MGIRVWPGANQHVYAAVRYEGMFFIVPAGVVALGVVGGKAQGFTAEFALTWGGVAWYREAVSPTFRLGWTWGPSLDRDSDPPAVQAP